MDNKYQVIAVENITENRKLFTLINLKNHDDYSCIFEENQGCITVLADDIANIYDVGEALFQYDLDMYDKLPIDMITFDMQKTYEDYYPGKGRCQFKTEEDFKKAYEKEKERINQLKLTEEELKEKQLKKQRKKKWEK